MPRDDSPLFDFVTTRAWALDLTVLQNLVDIVSRHVAGTRLTSDEIAAALPRKEKREEPERPYEVKDGVAVMPIHGVISKHASNVNRVSQPRGASTSALAAGLDQALADESVQSILLHIDSPGGAVDGVAELADRIHSARGRKPIHAVADGMMASAAYWLGSQADKVWTSPSAEVGSIGVYTVARDMSRLAANEGVSVHVVRAGEHKGAGVPGAQVTPEHLRGMQEVVDSYFNLFTSAVARGRGMDADAVSRVSSGKTWIGARAVEEGLADGVRTVDAAIASLAASHAKVAAAATPPLPFPDSTMTTNTFSTSTAVHVLNSSFKVVPVVAAGPTVSGASPTPQGDKMTQDTKVPAAPAAVDIEAVRKAAIEEERLRVSAIRSAMVAGQEKLADELIAAGTPLVEATNKLHTDLRERFAARAKNIQENTAKPFGITEEATAPAKPTDLIEAAKAEWASDPKVRDVFETAEQYAAYVDGMRSGHIHLVGARKEG